MSIVLRPGDQVDPRDDIVLRAGGGNVDSLTSKAIENAPQYRALVEVGAIRSAYSISVNIPRAGVADVDDILGSPGYVVYRPYLRAEAAQILALDYIDIVATTVTAEGAAPSSVDLSHFDIVVVAADETELRDRIEEIRARFTKQPNPKRPGTLNLGGESDA